MLTDKLSKRLNETMLNLKSLGPGLLYAAAAIGVSHLVQSTRAGADFGLQLIFAVIIANLVKYPIFKVGPVYTAVTGKSLLEGYLQVLLAFQLQHFSFQD